ncbi:MAG: hypothetical protein DI573_11345 [Microbacterium sp.]|uniref:MFS transporter n=1 Tax=unclassified Microbacterium TaxID=2609290 RepID=UPI000DB776EF|nr:MFS transporter [Microbacterium sp.]PZU37569.1 MAG: hypothetical protein DI573_11345 [Microbacterium sp.]
MSAPPWRVALSLQAALSQASWVGVRIMMGYRALELGGGALLLAIVAASFAVPTIAAALPAGRLSDRVGGSVIAFTGLVIACIGAAIAVFVPQSIPQLIVTTLIIGFGHLFVTVGQQTFVAHASRTGSADSGFGTLTAAASLGQLIGPPAVTLAMTLASSTPHRISIGISVCLAFTALALPLVLLLRSSDVGRKSVRRNGSRRTPLADVMRAPELWRALTASGAVLVTVDLLYTFVPLWAVSRDITPLTVGLLLALRAAVSVLSRLGLGRLVDRFGRRTLLLSAMGIGAIGLIALPFADQWTAIPVMIAMGIGLGLPQPLTMAWTIAITPAGAHGAALGLRLTANRAAQVAIPLLVGLIAAPIGLVGIFWANAAVLAGGVLIVATSHTSGTTGGDEAP